MLIDIDHVGLAVDDMDAAVQYYVDQFGLRVCERQVSDGPGVKEVIFESAGGAYLQLLAPTRDDSLIAQHLGTHGPGLHHLAWRVDSASQTVEWLRARGGDVDTEPRRRRRGGLVAFARPKPEFGPALELIEPADERAC